MGQLGEVALVDFTSGGSGTGISYYLEVMECPRKARLTREVRERYEGSEHNYVAMLKADVGTVFHKLAEVYHTGSGATVEIADPGAQPALVEGTRLFAAYTERFSPDFWGEVVGAEVHLPGEHDADCPTKDDPEQTCRCSRLGRARQLEELFGVPFTCRIDLVVRLDEAAAKRVGEKVGAPVEPGLYLLDHKTKGRKDSRMMTKYMNSLQFWSYIAAWNELHEEKAKGMLVNVVIANKKITDDQFVQVLVPPATPDQEVILGTLLNNAAALAGTDMPNAGACFGAFGNCPHWESGRCGRS